MSSSELVEIVVLVSAPILAGLAIGEYHRRCAIRAQRQRINR